MSGNKNRLNAFDRLMMAVTFAQADEPDTALDLAGKRPRKKNRKQNRARVERRKDHRPVLMS